MAKPYEQDVVLDADGKPLFDAVDTLARKIQGIQKTIAKIQQDSFKSAKDFNTTIDANVKALQKTMSQMRTLTQQDATERRQARALAAQDARQNVSRYGSGTTAVGYQFEQEKALQALQKAGTEKERVAALQALELANARLKAVQAIVREEERVARTQTTNQKADDTSAQRARLMLSRQTAQQNVENLGTENAVLVAKQRQVRAEEQLRAATALTRRERLQDLEAANAELRATERIAAAQARANRAGAGGGGPVGPSGPNSRLQNILSPGYAAAAFARTSIYGGAAMAAYGAFNAAQQGLTGAVQMQDELQKLQAISNATDSEMQTLTGSILDVGKSSRFAVVDIIKISQTLAQAGVSAKQMEPVLKSVLALATASGSTPDEAMNLITNAMGAFQLQASETGRVANLMTEALNRTKLTVTQVGQAIQYVGSTAYEQNISLEQLLATIGSVAQAGVKSGSTIGTGMRQFLVGLQEPTKKLTDELKKLGLSESDVDVTVRGLPAVLESLKKAGFGAAQAYEGLDVRAAAFYLTAKNNIDVADQLQLSFAHTNAAAIAQERAMDSLAAQWQKFKNIVQITISEDFAGTLDTLKRLLEYLSNRLAEIRNAQAERARKQAQGPSAYATGAVGYAMDYDLAPALTNGIEGILNLPGRLAGLPKDQQLGNWLDTIGKDTSAVATASKKLEDQISATNDELDKHRGTITEVNHEIVRLITQKESLQNNDVRSAAETATLTARFEGLSSQLINTGHRYDDLLQAARRYRLEQSRLLGIGLQASINQNRVGASQDASALTAAAQAAQSDRALMSALHPNARAALNVIQHASPQSQNFNQAFSILSDEMARLANVSDRFRDALNKVVTPAGSLANHLSAINTAAPALRDLNQQNTGLGQDILNLENTLESLVTTLASEDNGPKKKSEADQGIKLANDMIAVIDKRLKGAPNDAGAQHLRQERTELTGYIQQIKAAVTPTAEEIRTAKTEARNADKEQRRIEREERLGPPLTQAAFDEALRALSGGRALGSGPRTKAEEDELHRLGKTRATGATSAHSTGGIVRDIPTGPMSKADGDRLAQTIRQGLKAKFGIDFFVQFETGKGRNQGTGPHIHANARPGARVKPGSGDGDAAAAFQYDSQLAQDQLSLDQGDLSEKLKSLSKATTTEAFHTAILAAQAATNKVNNDLMEAAKNELANAGIAEGTPGYQAKMQQVQQQIAQNAETFQRTLLDAMMKSVDKMFKAAQDSFNAAIAPSQHTLAMMQGAANGLNRYSLRNQVPDYTRTLADAATARAQEAADRARAAAIPAQIARDQAALAGFQSDINGGLLDADHMEEARAKVVELTNSIESLKNTGDELNAEFGSGGLLPKTFGEGVQQAIAAYKELHNMTGSFGQLLSFEFTGAIDTTSNALQNMFATVIDGSRSALGAVGDFAKAIMQAISQIVAKILATQVINLLFDVFGSLAGGAAHGAGGGPPAGSGAGVHIGPPAFNGRAIPGYYGGGGAVTAGNTMRDSALARVAKGEWIVRRAAVQSVGHEFMNRLNREGANALNNTANTPAISIQPASPEINVWMVKPEEKPPMGPKDVLVTWQADVLSGGESKKLIQRVAKEQ